MQALRRSLVKAGFEVTAASPIPTPKQQKLFHHFFKKPVNFFYNELGFDLIMFDDWLKTPDGTSTEEFIRKKHGEAAVVLVRSLF